jgi:hypothetical protein
MEALKENGIAVIAMKDLAVVRPILETVHLHELRNEVGVTGN